MSIYEQYNSEAYVILLKIETSTGDFFYTNNTENIIYSGDTYEAKGFVFQLPDKSDKLENVTIRIDNVDREMVIAMRTHVGARPVVTAWVYTINSDSILTGPFEFIASATGNVNERSIDIVIEYENYLLNSVFPKLKFSPAIFLGLFKSSVVTIG